MQPTGDASRFTTVRQARRAALLQFGIVAVLLILVYQALEVVSSARAYVGGEGLWSKAQKNAVYHLLRYSASRDSLQYHAFLQALEVPLGDRIARLELERPHPDPARVRQGFLQGRNDPDDVARMATFFRRFRRVSYVRDAIGYWTQGDSLIAELADAGAALQRELSRPAGDSRVVAVQLSRVERISDELAVLEDAFSASLGQGARWAARVGFGLIVLTAATLLGLAAAGEWRAVSRSRRAEEALRASEARLRELVEQATFGIGSSTVEGRLLSANRALARMLGYDSAEALLAASPVMSRVYRDPAERERVIRQFVEGSLDRAEFEPELVRPDGTGVRARVTARALRDATGRVTGIEYFAEDVTTRRALEAQLRQAQKMEAVGQLTGGLAHDFNNLLTVILATAELVGDALPAGETRGRADLADLKNTARRGAEMIRKLLAFSRTKQLQFHSHEAQSLVRAATLVLRRVLPEDIEVRLDLPPEPLYFKSDPAALEQILLNLATNARDAMPHGGLIIVRLATVARRPAGDGPWVTVTVEDTGTGMSPETLARVFEPFFTTKQPGRGSGLGMTMVYGLMAQHGGQVDVESAPGRGTTVQLHFPPAGPEAEAAAPPAPPSEPGGGTILLVEDEAPLRRAARRLLEQHGYRVLEAEDGEEALEICAAHAGAVDVVLSDVVMPRLGGRGLYDALRERGVRIPFLFMSGYVAQEGPGPLGLPEGIPFLPKPWGAEDLVRSVQAAMRTETPGPGGPSRPVR